MGVWGWWMVCRVKEGMGDDPPPFLWRSLGVSADWPSRHRDLPSKSTQRTTLPQHECYHLKDSSLSNASSPRWTPHGDYPTRSSAICIPLSDDNRSFRNLSLVAKSWLDPSQRDISSSTHLTPWAGPLWLDGSMYDVRP